MLNKSILILLLVLNISNTYSYNIIEKEEVVIKIVNEVNDHMKELKFEIQNDFSDEELKNWLESSKKIQIIKEAKMLKKKSNHEMVWVFDHVPTLKDFKVMFALQNIQKVEVNGKVMSAVEFTTFGFSANDSNVKE